MSDYNFNFGPPWLWVLILVLAIFGATVIIVSVGWFICNHIRLV